MRKLQKTEKIPGHCKWKRVGPSPQYNFSFFPDTGLQMLNHKGKPRIVVFVGGDRYFESCNVFGPHKARLLIGWLARYIAMADADQVSLSIASTKAHAKLITYEQDKIAAELGLQK